MRSIARKVLPLSLRRKLAGYLNWPPVGSIQYGSFRRLEPFNRDWGARRGTPIDRFYIEAFLYNYTPDVKGHVLEVKDNTYTLKYGRSRVSQSDILHKVAGNPRATIVADLTRADHLPTGVFDCIICTQTLQFIYDFSAAVKTLHRILKPEGVLLVTLPGITQISRYDMEQWGDYWRFTSKSARTIFEEFFPGENVSVQAYGNVFAATAFLYGIAAEELDRSELDLHDPDYEMLVAVRADKPGVSS